MESVDGARLGKNLNRLCAANTGKYVARLQGIYREYQGIFRKNITVQQNQAVSALSREFRGSAVLRIFSCKSADNPGRIIRSWCSPTHTLAVHEVNSPLAGNRAS
jgi:hypothetical protein